MKNRVGYLVICAAAGLAPLLEKGAPPPAEIAAEWPATFENRPLVNMPMDDMEARFNANFPGEVARFNDGERQLILRWVNTGTRKLHSSADCFRGLGYAVTPAPAWQDGQGSRWSCFVAESTKHRLHVRERIVEKDGVRAWTDVSAWYWSTLLQQSRGPWLATTVVEAQNPSALERSGEVGSATRLGAGK